VICSGSSTTLTASGPSTYRTYQWNTGATTTNGIPLRAAATAFFRYYADNPRDLDLGFYLFRGGMKPQGLGKERDDILNAALESAMQPIADAAQALGARREEARSLMADIFAHAAGLLLLAHTGRIRMFGASALNLMERFVEGAILTLTAKRGG